MNKNIGKVLSALLLLVSTQVFATAYTLPPSNASLIGQMEYISAALGDNVVNIAKRYDIGFNAMENANPYISMKRGFTPGVPLVIATQHLLPNETREGIVINLPEMRMYYYVGNGQVLTYPIGIGKIGKTIPITRTAITRKTKNPVWIPPEDIRQFNLEQGIVLPKVMPPGPDNPLGPYAIYMKIPTYLIHSTIFPESVGTRASFGCIRMYETDIEDFFPSIKSGIPVVITNKPIKLGWENERLYIEAHEPLEEHNSDDVTIHGIVHHIASTTQHQPMLVDWQLVSYIAAEKDGIPHEIGTPIPRT